MKQKDIALIIMIAGFSAFASFFISSKLFVTSTDKAQKAEVVDVINSAFDTPSNKYFNSNSIDPTSDSTIGDSNNQNPFNGTSQ